MRRISMTVSLGLVLALAACGGSPGVRAAAGGVGGLVVAGPVGAVVGATAGAATAKK